MNVFDLYYSDCIISYYYTFFQQVELFRELQLLNTDYLRQRALYALEQLVTRLLKDEDEILNDTVRSLHVHVHVMDPFLYNYNQCVLIKDG